MKKLLLIALLGSVYGTVINVPSDYATIQEGIDAAVDTDTVLVAQGAYYENLIIEKNITLTSNAIYDDLSEWTEFSVTFGQYELLNDNIDNTVINGSLDTNGDDLQSVIYINSPDGCIEPVIFGFTITGGDGKLVTYQNDEGETVSERRGGGFYSNNALPEIHYNYIHDNNGTSESPIHSGGGTDIDLNERCEGDIDLSYNFYRDNDALYGNTLATNGYAGSLDMSNSIFDVYNCPEEEVTPVWVDVEEEVEVDFQYSAGDLCSITEDVWVSPEGDDYLNTGTSAGNAFLTIETALALIAPSDENIITINLTEGTFAPSTTSEPFSIIMISNVNLIGQGEEVTILDAEETDRVITMEFCQNNIISALTITGGNTSSPGGGIYFINSNPTITHVTISGNTADDYGGGIYIKHSNPTITHVTISGNTSAGNYTGGGGMYLGTYSNPTITHVTISGNSATHVGGGMYLGTSNPILTHVILANNTASTSGGGMYLHTSNPNLIHVTITENTVTDDDNITDNFGGGMYLYYSDPTLTHVTISGNTATNQGGGMRLKNSNPTLTNSIIWNNSPESIYLHEGTEEPIITYSDIEGGWEGEWNIDSDPLFNEDFTLQAGSPCIDTGDESLWYEDLNGTRADIGATGGQFTFPNFKSHDFGEVGDIGSSKQFNLYNYRQTPITISEVNFNTSSFTTNTSFPITIEPLQTGIINIDANNSVLGHVADEMELVSDNLPEGISVSLSVTGAGGDVLTGNLSGIYPVATYRISGDIIIANDDTVYLEAGTELLFDGGVNFNVYGTLKAIGTESDSIIFDNFSDEKWRGFTLDGASDETEFQYVKIFGAEKDDGGGMYLGGSNPTLTHVTIANNTAGGNGGGMRLYYSNPTLTHVNISNNTAHHGGGMRLYYSNPTLNHVTINGNTAESWSGGMGLYISNPTLNHVTISGNTATNQGGGMRLNNSNPTLTNSIIWDNSPESIYEYGQNTTPIITNSDIEGDTTWTGEGNINIDPLFTDTDNDDYTLQEGSPCIDTGIVIEDMEYCGIAPDMGAYEYCEELSVASETHMPIHYSLNAAYPNPFNPVTSIAYSLPQNGNVKLIVYNIQGRQIETLVNDFQTSGYHFINWNATSYPSGVYLIRMESGEFTQTQKVVLVK